MANHHHGNVGDVVKHLVLGEALASERPGRYLESHAGDTDYPLPWPRFADVQAFRVACERDGELRATTYAGALAAAPDRSPGSVALAARALPDAQLLALDLDAGSVDSLRSLDGGRIRAHAADGLNGVLAEARLGDVAFLDPFDPRLGDAVSVFSALAARGVRTAFWYATGPGAPLAAPPAATRIEVTVPTRERRCRRPERLRDGVRRTVVAADAGALLGGRSPRGGRRAAGPDLHRGRHGGRVRGARRRA